MPREGHGEEYPTGTLTSVAHSLRDGYSVVHTVAWVQHDSIARRKAGGHFRNSAISVIDLNQRGARATVYNPKNRPTVTFPK